MSDSVQRLTAVGAEDRRKDELVSNLRKELAAYKKNSRHKEFRFVCSRYNSTCDSLSTITLYVATWHCMFYKLYVATWHCMFYKHCSLYVAMCHCSTALCM